MLIVYKIVNNKKITILERLGHNKELLKKELKNKNIKYDGIDRILNFNW